MPNDQTSLFPELTTAQDTALHSAQTKRAGRDAAPILHQGSELFSFGEPVPVLDQRQFFDFLELTQNDKWYEPPISLSGLEKSIKAAVHHASAITVKCNILSSTFIPHTLLSGQAFHQIALEFLIYGNCYLQKIKNSFGQVIQLKPALAKYVRRGVDDREQYYFLGKPDQEFAFESGGIVHLLEHDTTQEIYGMPNYLSCLNSVWLNEAATLFRRKYYKNGSHAGYIMYLTDPLKNEVEANSIKDALKNSKGPGNFRNLFVYSPNGKKDGLQIIPIGEVMAKDEFVSMKNVTRDDQLAAHRVPPQMMGILPNNTGGFGDVEKAAQVFARNEIVPLQSCFEHINAVMGSNIVRFKPYSLI